MKVKRYSRRPRWMKGVEAASYLRLSINTIRNLTSARCIPIVRRGRITRYRQDDLDRWLAQDVCAGRATFADPPTERSAATTESAADDFRGLEEHLDAPLGMVSGAREGEAMMKSLGKVEADCGPVTWATDEDEDD